MNREWLRETFRPCVEQGAAAWLREEHAKLGRGVVRYDGDRFGLSVFEAGLQYTDGTLRVTTIEYAEIDRLEPVDVRALMLASRRLSDPVDLGVVSRGETHALRVTLFVYTAVVSALHEVLRRRDA